MINVKNWGGGHVSFDMWKCACTCVCNCICGCPLDDHVADCQVDAYLGDDISVTNGNWYSNKITGI